MFTYEKLLYLDKEFISLKYENEKGVNPDTQITRSEGLSALAKIPLFSGGASTTESKTFQISTMGMLTELESSLKNYSEFDSSKFKLGSSSQICRIEGHLTINTIKITRHTSTITIIGPPKKRKTDNNGPELVGEESYYAVEGDKYKFALVPTENYWVSGIAAFQNLANNVIGPLDIPIKALLRIYSAHTSFEEWMAVPLVITEK